MKKIGCWLLLFLVFPVGVSAVNEIPLGYTAVSKTAETGGHWAATYFTPAVPKLGAFNYVGLRGDITMTYTGNGDPTVLVYVMAEREGACPPTGVYYNPNHVTIPEAYTYPFVKPLVLASYILRRAGTGTVTIPTNFVLPTKVPVSGGCITLRMMGGELNTGEIVTTTSRITFLFDTEAPLKPEVKPGSFASEMCIGRKVGCYQTAETINPGEAFAIYQRIDGHKKITSWIGNTNTSTSRAGLLQPPIPPCPPGNWTSNSDYYIFKAGSCPIFVGTTRTMTAGPSVEAGKIPVGAINLFSSTINGNQCNGGQNLIDKKFQPPVEVNKGDCMVQVQKFSAPEGGVVTEETQSTFATQEINLLGHLDSNSNCLALNGWVGNTIDPFETDEVNFYIDGTAAGNFLGKATANLTRSAAVCDALGYSQNPCNHGFVFNVPSTAKDGQTHTIYAYGVNKNEYVKLSGSGMNINCQGTTLVGDFNNDGVVNMVDFSVWKTNYLAGKSTLVEFGVWKKGYLGSSP